MLRTLCSAASATHSQFLFVTFDGSYMAERMAFRAKELLVEKAAMEEAMAKEEVPHLRWCTCWNERNLGLKCDAL